MGVRVHVMKMLCKNAKQLPSMYVLCDVAGTKLFRIFRHWRVYLAGELYEADVCLHY